MATRMLEVANMAIGHTGAGTQISSLTEDSTEARACNQFIIIARNTMLKAYDWHFARRLDVPLALLKTQPTPKWGYSYLRPGDCLKLRYLGSDQEDYIETLDDEKNQVFYSNQSPLTATYTSDDLPDNYPDDVALGWSYALGMLIIPQVSEGNIKSHYPVMKEGYGMAMGQAIENNANTESPSIEESPAMLARGSYGIYP